MALSWKKGLSRSSIGRFGSLNRKEYFDNTNGFLCWNDKGLYAEVPLSVHKYQEMGFFNPPLEYIHRKKKNWVTVKNDLLYYTGKALKSKIRFYQTLLSPAFLYDIDFNNFRWTWMAGNHGANNFALPLSSGVKTCECSYIYSKEKDGKLKEPWMLLWFSTTRRLFDVPMLLVFQHNPKEIKIVSNEHLDITFNGKAGYVAVMPLFGNEVLNKEITREWNERLPNEISKKCSKWAKILMNFPVGNEEEFAVDRGNKRVLIKNKTKFIRIKNDWGIKGEEISPLPPVLVHALQRKYDVKIQQKAFPLELKTKIGPLYGIKGNILEYSLPEGPDTAKTIAPVRIREDKLFDKLNNKLYKYLLDPYLTFGGDFTYDPANIQDTLHNLRIMAWTTKSLAGEKRKKALASISRGLKNMVKSSYNVYTEPELNSRYLAEKTIFDNKGLVDYDLEWYNGMQLRGLWAYYFFGDRKKAIDLIKRKKDIINGLLNYYKIFSDWSTLACWSSARGIITMVDGVNYSWEGIVGLNRISRDLNDKETYEWSSYLLAKMSAFIFSAWTPDGKNKDLTVDLVFERGGLNISKHLNEGIMSACSLDLMLFLERMGMKEKIRKYTFETMPKTCPEWYRKYKKYIKGFPGHIEQICRHYFLEPHFIYRAIMFRESTKNLLNYDKALTGQVIEAIMVGAGPIAIIPTEAIFKEHIWDKKSRIQTLIFEGINNKLLPLEILTRNKPVKMDGMFKMTANRKAGKFSGYIQMRYGEETKITIRYS